MAATEAQVAVEGDAPGNPAAAPVPASGGIFGRVARGVGALSLGALVKIASQLTIVPVAMGSWGEARYGEWLVLAGLVTFLSLADVGLQAFVVNRMCASYVREDRDDLHRLLHSALRVQLPLTVVVLGGLAAVLAVVPLRDVLELHTVSGVETEAVAMLLALELLISVPMGVIAGLYRATGRLPRAAAISSVQQAILLATMLGLIASHASFGTVALARVGIGVVAAVLVSWDLKRLYPWLRLKPTMGSLAEGMAMVLPGVLFLLIPLADFIGTQSTLTIIQHTLAGGEVSRYSTHRTVANLAVMASGMLTVAAWPELTALHARAQGADLRALQRTLVKVNVWVVGGLSLGMVPLLPWVYPSWTAGRLRLDLVVAGVLIARTVLWGVWNGSMTVLLSTNRHARVAGGLVASAVVTAALAALLVPRLGIRGAALASLLGDAAVAGWYVPRLAAREIGDSLGGFWAEVAPAVLLGLAVPAAVGVALWTLVPWAAVRVPLVLFAGTAVALPLAWTRLSPAERAFVGGIARRVAGRRRR